MKVLSRKAREIGEGSGFPILKPSRIRCRQAVLIPSVIGVGILVVHQYRKGRDRLEHDTLQTARALVQAVDNQILQIRAFAFGLASSDSLMRGDLPAFHRQARQAVMLAKLGPSVVLADRSGRQVLNTLKEFGEPLPLTNIPDLVERLFETGKPQVSDLYLGAVTGRPIMTLVVPVVVKGEVAYALIAPILAECFDAILGAQKLPESWLTAILDSTGTIVARTRDSSQYVGQSTLPGFLQSYRQSLEGFQEGPSKKGIPTNWVVSRSSSTGWGVAIGMPSRESAAGPVRSLAFLSAGSLIRFALGLGLASGVGRRIADSVQSLKRLSMDLVAGVRLDLPALRVQEVDDMARAMGEAAKLLEERNMALWQTNARLDTLIEHAPAAIAIFDREMLYLAVSQRWSEDYGLLGRELTGASHYDVLPDLPEAWKEAHRRGLTGEVAWAKEDRFEREGGSVLWLHWEIWPWGDGRGAIGGIVIATEDITERKEAEAALRQGKDELEVRVAERTAELRAANRELKAITFATSHDLKGPLGRINSFSTLLEQRYRERMGGKVWAESASGRGATFFLEFAAAG